MNLYISTMAFLGQAVEEMIDIGLANNYALEFSSALPYQEGIVDLFAAYPHPKLAHNYFPAPAVPFVLNLASQDEVIRKQSIAHCMQGLALSAAAGAPFFAAHAGFCLDPKPEELGRKLKQSSETIDREKHWSLFAQSIEQILNEAERLSVDFYIENNVTAAMNLNQFGQNPLLCSTPNELHRLATQFNHPRFGLLLDTAHLKVSGQTLDFDLAQGVHLIQPFIKAIHHSDNDGLLDSNDALDENYWFFDFITAFNHIPQVIEVKKLDQRRLKEQIQLLQSKAGLLV